MPRVPVNQPYTVTTPFGVPDSNALFGRHSGIDYAVPLGRPIYAPASGTLRNIVSPTGGNMVKIFDGKYWHRLMHNNSFSRGDGPVSEGQEVAKAGTTGLSTGVHCHWDISVKEVATGFADFIDPNVYLKEGGNMPLTQSEKDKLIKAMKQAPPTAAELGDPTYDDPSRAINDFWEAYGKHTYAESQKPKEYVKVDELYIRKG